MPKLYVFGGSFNPPGVHHTQAIRRLAQTTGKDDQILIMPCGHRPDKERTDDVDAAHRAAMVTLAFGGIDKVDIDLSDLERDKFTRTWDLEERLRGEGHTDIWHVVGSDLVADGKSGTSEIQRTWHRGRELWEQRKFLVFHRDDLLVDPNDLPPHNESMDSDAGSSSHIRALAAERKPIDDLVPPRVGDYIRRHQLYTGRVSQGPATFMPRGKPRIISDRDRPRVAGLSSAIVDAYGRDIKGDQDHIIVVGGDGFMLDAIHKFVNDRIPFVGVNAGTRGFLLNDGTPEEIAARLRRPMVSYRQPLLRATFRRRGEEFTRHAFNEVFLNNGMKQTGWMRVTVDGVVRFERLEADGLMLSTAGGSTGWAKSYGAMPIPIGTPLLMLVGVGACSNGRPWSFAPLPLTSTVEVEVLETQRRPMKLAVDGTDEGLVDHVTMRLSRSLAAEICFFPETDLAGKISQLYFPQE